MRTLTPSERLSLQVSIALVAGMFSVIPHAYALPVGGTVKFGDAKINKISESTMNIAVPEGKTSPNNVINWQDYSVANGQSVIYDGGAHTNNYLNNVIGAGSSYIDGNISGGKNVYIVNPNGVYMGSGANINVGSLYVSTKQLNVDKLVDGLQKGEATLDHGLNGTYSINGTDSINGIIAYSSDKTTGDVVNMGGKIRANEVEVNGQNIRFLNTKDITSDGTTPLQGVTLTGSGYVHVGYEAGEEATSQNNLGSDKTAGQYTASNIDTSKSASSLGYVVNGQTATADSNDFALVRNNLELRNMNSNPSINYMLSKNIDLGSSAFTPIGDASAPFSGDFDGNYHTISNLKVDETTYAGLFGKVQGKSDSDRASIMNVGVVGAQVKSSLNGYAGGVVGYAQYLNLQNVYNEHGQESQGVWTDFTQKSAKKQTGTGTQNYYCFSGTVGGVIGYAANSKIDGVYNTGNVRAGAGIVGNLKSSILTDAYNAGTITNYDYTVTGDTATQDSHYAIADVISNSTVKNVFTAGEYKTGESAAASGWSTSYTHQLAPSTANFTNAYIIDTSQTTPKIATVIKDTTSAYYKNNSSAPSATASAYSAANYGLLGATAVTENDTTTYIANTKSEDGKWRIYDGHSLPLLRDILKGNKGTVSVGASYALYAPNGTTANSTARLTGVSLPDGTMTYNGYYLGATQSGNLPSGVKADTTTRIKNAGKSATFFYDTAGQHGTDLADDTVNILKRELAPTSGEIKVTKVYDATTDAKDEVAAAFGLGDNAIDEAAYYAENGTFYNYGVVKTTATAGATAVSDSVVLSGKAVESADFADKNVRGGATSADWVTPDSEGRYWQNMSVTFGGGGISDEKSQAGDTADGDGAYDYENYSFSPSQVNKAVTNGKLTFKGYITPRPVYVGLQTSTGIDKTYDKTGAVTYVGTAWTDSNGDGKITALDNAQTVTLTAAQLTALGIKEGDYGFVAADGSGLTVGGTDFDLNGDDIADLNAPFYSANANSTKPVSNANTTANAYTVNYVLTPKAGNDGFDNANNYAFYSIDDPENPLHTDANGAYLQTGTGTINKRAVEASSLVFSNEGKVIEGVVKDNEGHDVQVHATKVYDGTSALDVDAVTFSSAGTPVTVADAVNQVTTTGIVKGDEGLFGKFAMVKNNPGVFLGEDGTTEAKSYSGATQTTAAKKAKYTFTNTNADIFNNYDLQGLKNEGNGIYSVTREATITQRDLSLALKNNSDIDKYYDGTAAVRDSSTVAYTKHTDDDSGKGNVTYASGSLAKVDDGTAWNISAAYQQMGTEAAKDVYLVNNTVTDKDIKYSVSLKKGDTATEDYSENYVLHVGNTAYDQAKGTAAVLDASGAIKQRPITGLTFGDVSKLYDGTAAVGKVGSITQSGNAITIKGATVDTTDGVSVNEAGLVGEDTLKNVFGESLGTYNETNKTFTYNGDVIKGKYGQTAFVPDGTNDEDFKGDQHAYDLDGNGTGAERYVKYTGISSALSAASPNYVLADNMSDTQYGKGTINPLTVTKVERKNGSNLSKIYDGGTSVVGGYNIKYTTENNGDQIITTGTIKQIDGSDVADALGNVTITGKDSAKQDVTVGLTYATDYTLDKDATKFNSKNVKAGTTDTTYATSVNYAITSLDEYGDYVFSQTATAADNGFTSADGKSANIAGTGSITPRALYMQEAGTFSKTYDGTTVVKDADGKEVSGDSAVTINAANEYSGLVSSAIAGGYIDSANADNVTNASTAEYTGDIDSSSGYEAKDANVYTDGLHSDRKTAKSSSYYDTTGNTVIYYDGDGKVVSNYTAIAAKGTKDADGNPLYTATLADGTTKEVHTKQGGKLITFTMALSDGNKNGNYSFWKDTNLDGKYAQTTDASGNTFTTNGHNIEQADLTLNLDYITKTFDGNAYVRDYTDAEGNTTKVALTYPNVTAGETAAGTEAVDKALSMTGLVTVNGVEDDVTATITQDSAYQQGDTKINGTASDTLAARNAGEHKVQYVLNVAGDDLQNYNLKYTYDLSSDHSGTTTSTSAAADANTADVTKQDGSGANSSYLGVKVMGQGYINPLTVNSVSADVQSVSKVYDGTASVSYNHTAADGFDSTQQGSYSAANNSAASTLKLGNINLLSSDYELDDANTVYTGTDGGKAGTGKKVTWAYTLGKDFMENVSFSPSTDGSYVAKENADHSYSLKYFTDGATTGSTTEKSSITPKNIYAYVNETGQGANPTKSYGAGGNNTVLTGTAKDASGDTITDAKGYVTINGLADGDSTKYSVAAAYDSSSTHVVRDAAGKVLEGKNVVDYSITLDSGIADNYKLFTMDGDGTGGANVYTYTEGVGTPTNSNFKYYNSGNVYENGTLLGSATADNYMAGQVNQNQILTGTGTITPATPKLTTTIAQKVYDGGTAIDVTDDNDNDTNIPTFTLAGVNGETLGLTVTGGDYGTYTAADGFKTDANVGTKAVRYTGVSVFGKEADDSLSGLISDYDFSASAATGDISGSNGYLYDANKKTLTYSANPGLGKITKLVMNGTVTVNFTNDPIEKVYDGSRSVAYDHKTGSGMDDWDADGLTYKAYGYDNTQVGSKAASAYIDNDAGIVLTDIPSGTTYNLTANDYDITKALFDDAGVGDSPVTYEFTLKNTFGDNISFTKTGETKALAGGTKLTGSKSGTITAKNVYASLSAAGLAANPTKQYDGDAYVVNDTSATDETKVGGEATLTNAGISANTIKNYVTVKGLITADSDNSNYSVAAAYKDENVKFAGDEVASQQNAIDYTVTVNNNYKLYTVDTTGATAEGSTATTGTLTTGTGTNSGAGTITQREIGVDFGFARRAYVADGASVKFSETETGDKNPLLAANGFAFSNLVDGQDLTFTTNGTDETKNLTGTFKASGSGDGDGDADVNTTVDDTVSNTLGSTSVGYKGVEYGNLSKALANGTNGTAANYKLVDDGSGVYNGATDTLSYDYTAAKGQITKRGISKIANSGINVTKEYDGNGYVKDPTDSFKVYGVYDATAYTGTTDTDGDGIPDGAVNITYTLMNDTQDTSKKLAVYATPTTDGTGYDATTVQKDANVKTGTANYQVVYGITKLNVEDRNYELSGSSTDEAAGYTKKYITGTGTITPRVISGAAQGNMVKTYDGTTDGLALTVGSDGQATAIDSNGTKTAYFAIDNTNNNNDVEVLKKDYGEALNDVIDVTATYADKTANADKNGATLTGKEPDKDVYYKITRKGALAGDLNYKLEDVTEGNNGYTGSVNGSKGDYVGTGDIKQRVVYVTDKGGVVLSRDYQGTDVIDTPYDGTTDGASANPRLALVDAVGDTGIVVNQAEGVDDSFITLDYDNIQDNYVDNGDVARDAGGKVTNKAVKFTHIALKNNADNNYVLEAQNPSDSSYTLTGANAVAGATYKADTDADGITITETQGGRIKPKEISVKVAQGPIKVYDAKRAVSGSYENNVGDTVEYASKDNIKQNSASVVLPNNTANVALKENSTPYYTSPNVKDNRDTGEVVYQLTLDNPNYELVSGAPTDEVAVTGYNGNVLTYDLTSKTGTIKPRTLENITAVSDVYKDYDGSPDIRGSYRADGTAISSALGNISVSGLQGSDTVAGIMSATGTYMNANGVGENANAATGESAGSDLIAHRMQYDLSLTGGTDSNYRFSDAGAVTYSLTGDPAKTGTINRVPLRVAGESQTIRYGQAYEPTGAVVESDFVNGESLESLSGTTGSFDYVRDGNNVYGWYTNRNGDQMRYGRFTYFDDASNSRKTETGWYPYTEGTLHYGANGWYAEGGAVTGMRGFSNPNFGSNYYLEQVPGRLKVVGGPETTEPSYTPSGNNDHILVVTTADSSIYHQLSHDFNNNVNRDPASTISYTSTDGRLVESGLENDSDSNNSQLAKPVTATEPEEQQLHAAGTITIEASDVVNLQADTEVASDGDGKMATRSGVSNIQTDVAVTEEGYLSVAQAGMSTKQEDEYVYDDEEEERKALAGEENNSKDAQAEIQYKDAVA